MIVAAAVINAVVLNHAVNVNNVAAIHVAVAIIMVVMAMDLDSVADVLGSGLFLFYSSAVVDLDLAEDSVGDSVDTQEDSAKNLNLNKVVVIE